MDHSSDPCAAGPHRLDDTLVWLLAAASGRAQRLVRERLAAHGVRKWDHAVLAVLAEYGPSAQAGLCRRLGVDRSDMVAILNGLEGEGYVRREPDPEDRRRNRVELTAEGRSVLARYDRQVYEADGILRESLSEADRDRLAELLGRLVRPQDAGG